MFFSLNCVSIYHFILKMMDFTYFRFSVMKNHNNSAFAKSLLRQRQNHPQRHTFGQILTRKAQLRKKSTL